MGIWKAIFSSSGLRSPWASLPRSPPAARVGEAEVARARAEKSSPFRARSRISWARARESLPPSSLTRISSRETVGGLV